MSRLQNDIDAQPWTWAKTYEGFAPHEYFKSWDNPPLFRKLLDMIEHEGRDEPFRIFKTVKTYRYYYLGEYKYWRMEGILNRTKTEGYE